MDESASVVGGGGVCREGCCVGMLFLSLFWFLLVRAGLL